MWAPMWALIIPGILHLNPKPSISMVSAQVRKAKSAEELKSAEQAEAKEARRVRVLGV